MAEARATLQPLNVKMPPPLQLNDSAIDEWKMFKQLFKNYQIIIALEQRDKAYQCAVFLHCIGPAGIKIYNGLEFAPAGPGNNIAEDNEHIRTIIEKFDKVQSSLARQIKHTRDMSLTNENKNQKKA